MVRESPLHHLRSTTSILLPFALTLLAVSPALRWKWPWLAPLHKGPLGVALVRIDEGLPGLLSSIGLAVAAYLGTLVAVGACTQVFKERGFKGRDLLKPGAQDHMYVLHFFNDSSLGSISRLADRCVHRTQTRNTRPPRVLHLSSSSVPLHPFSILRYWTSIFQR